MKKLFGTIPLAKLTIIKTLKSEFPYFRHPHCKITAYIDNLLEITEYSPCFTNEILKIIFENMLLIDVNVTKDQIDQAEEEETVDQEEDFSVRMRLPLAETLDHCMENMLEYFHNKFSGSNINTQNVITEAIFEYFDEHIIKTFTKHLHFCIFYISSVNVSGLNIFFSYNVILTCLIFRTNSA
jgi:RNA polymerase I specific transcription initiation factor RRN3